MMLKTTQARLSAVALGNCVRPPPGSTADDGPRTSWRIYVSDLAFNFRLFKIEISKLAQP